MEIFLVGMYLVVAVSIFVTWADDQKDFTFWSRVIFAFAWGFCAAIAGQEYIAELWRKDGRGLRTPPG